MANQRLVLFDIDGTLITDGGAAREAFAEALRGVYGYRGDVNQYDFSGRTDPQIAFMLLRDEGFADDAIEARLGEFWQRYLVALERNVTSDRVRALPGITPLLDALADVEHVTLALLTGNIERGARLKLAPPGFNDFFPFGAFGSDSPDREKLPPIAVERATKANGRRFAREDIVIIGDSIYDVRCGVPHNATTIAVASGKTPAGKLRGENPTHFFDTVEDLDAVLGAILG